MKVRVKLLRKQGRILRVIENDNAPAFIGDLSVAEARDHKAGRTVIRANLFDVVNGTKIDVLPELINAQLLWARDNTMCLAGMERIEAADYAQTWSIEVV